MKNPYVGSIAAPLLALALAGAAPVAAQAQGMTDGWQFEATVYGWFPAISGNTSFPPDNNGPSVDVSMRDVIDALKFAFMGTFEARRDQWGLWTDLVYADFGASKTGTRDVHVDGVPLPVGVTADLSLDIKSWIWTLAGSYNLRSDTEGYTDVLFGMRMLDMTNTLDATFSSAGPLPFPPRSGVKEVSVTNWDAIVGLKGRAFLGEERKWYVPYYVDIGTGESKLTWSVNVGVGYQFGWGSLLATWRYMDYSFKSDSRISDLSFNGPTIGASFKF